MPLPSPMLICALIITELFVPTALIVSADLELAHFMRTIVICNSPIMQSTEAEDAIPLKKVKINRFEKLKTGAYGERWSITYNSPLMQSTEAEDAIPVKKVKINRFEKLKTGTYSKRWSITCN